MLGSLVNTINRHQWISESAYFKAEARGFEPGKDLDVWLAAQIDYADMLIAAYIAILPEDGAITLASLRQLAALIGIENSDNLFSEIELIHAIQKAANHHACFHPNPDRLCNETDCQWRTECQKLIAAWH